MTDSQDSALDLEDSGDYEEAARVYAENGFSYLLKGNFEPIDSTRWGIAHMLQAVSCDIRAGNRSRAEGLSEIIESVLFGLIDQSSDATLEGIYYEWLGDCATMLGDPAAISKYRTAGDRYKGMSWEDSMWWQEPEYIQAYWAIQRFQREYDGCLPENVDGLDFQERIDCKLAFAERFAER